MAYFPFFIDLAAKEVLVVGGGEMALAKVKRIAPYGPRITVLAERFIKGLADCPEVNLRTKRFAEEDLKNMFCVIAADEDYGLNHRVAHLCQKLGILVNVVDDLEYCSFLFPSLIRQGALSIGISTSGASPTAAVYLKKKVEAVLPVAFGEILSYLSALRPKLKEEYPSEALRKALYGALFRRCLACGRGLTLEETAEVIQHSIGGGGADVSLCPAVDTETDVSFNGALKDPETARWTGASWKTTES